MITVKEFDSASLEREMIQTLNSLVKASVRTNHTEAAFYEEEKKGGSLVKLSNWKELEYVCGKLIAESNYTAEGEFCNGLLNGEGKFEDFHGNFF